MSEKNKIVQYKNFRLSKLNTEEFRHLKYLLYWPLYGLFFLGVERFWLRDSYYPMHCVLDDYIPFCEYFLIPYLFWFVFLLGFMAYALFWDVESFKRMMKFIMFTYSATIVIYILFPNCQQLRPQSFARDNVFTAFIKKYYIFDTNTNVCPSIHVIGSMAVLFAAWHSKHFHSARWRAVFVVMTAAISVSTVFLKQHSVLDILAALPLCFVGYVIAFRDLPGRVGRNVKNRGVMRKKRVVKESGLHI
ncbi:MAG: phosphatidic acid phosphatase [Clostridia bacterium]